MHSFLDVRPGDLVSWLDEAGLPDGLPFLLSPRFEYDVALNSYFFRGRSCPSGVCYRQQNQEYGSV